MGKYQPLYISKMETGLVQQRPEFILPNDAYPILENAYVFREKILRKSAYQTVGRLRRNIGTTDGAGNLVVVITPIPIAEGIASFEIGSNIYIDPGGASPVNLLVTGIGTASLDRATGTLTIAGSDAATDVYYFPRLPVMGCRTRELNAVNTEETVFFDQNYAYVYTGAIGSGTFDEFIPGTEWHSADHQFFWTTNYWVSPPTAPVANVKIFWATNFNIDQTTRDPIRYTDGATWIDFAPTINSDGDVMSQCLALLPFRGRLVAFRTFEGPDLASGVEKFQRIRWAAIGNPISDISSIFPVNTINDNAWRDDIQGRGGFLDIPTSQAIVAVGFVRDNLVIYCERSTWQLRYTGRTIAPFQIERVNAELGAESTFSTVQFDTNMVGIGDKGVVQCDSFKSNLIDIKIPDLIFSFKNTENGTKRVYGVRDFFKRLAYWTYVNPPDTGEDLANPTKFPNRRLVYNYENDSWAIYTDSFTCFGSFQSSSAIKWEEADFSWESANFPWVGKPALFPYLVAGNHQGYILLLDQLSTNQESLTISQITGNDPMVTSVRSVNHNLQSGDFVTFQGITGDFSDLNNIVFQVTKIDNDNFEIYSFNSVSGVFDIPNIHAAGTYGGLGEIRVRDNFRVRSKKFNFLEQGQNIQLGFIDVLLNATTDGAISLNIYADYNQTNPVNTRPNNLNPTTGVPDQFFNTVINTYPEVDMGSQKNWQRIYCPIRAGFITTEFTFSDSQMNGTEQESEVQIDSQIMWIRRAGTQIPAGV